DMPLGLTALLRRVINAGDERRLGTDQPAELIRDRREHLARPSAAGYQRGHAPQRGLLTDKLTPPCPIRQITARPCVADMVHSISRCTVRSHR
ncbi:MAG: hypothetical protein ACRDU0_16210, partial [Mycobacterium sp.]